MDYIELSDNSILSVFIVEQLPVLILQITLHVIMVKDIIKFQLLKVLISLLHIMLLKEKNFFLMITL